MYSFKSTIRCLFRVGIWMIDSPYDAILLRLSAQERS